MRVLIPMLLLPAMLSCKKKPPEVSAARAQAELSQHMQGHFELATSVRNGVIWGDLSQTRHSGQTMADHSDEAFPADWQPQLAKMHEAAVDARDATDLNAGAQAVARLGRACGGCHTALERGPVFDFPKAPPEDKSVISRMQRHQWAADRMWEGIISNEPSLFATGARAMSTAPLWGEEALPEEVQPLDAQLKELGKAAASADTDSARVQAYGRLLATCATCHHIARP